jgi:nitrous oxidase accessory protein
VGAAVCSVLLFLVVAQAAVITVDHNGGAYYVRIQDAISAAHSGDIIEVRSGIYHEHVNITKPLTLKGSDTGNGKPVIDAGGNGSAVILSANSTTVEGLNVTGAGDWPDAGISLRSSHNLIHDNVAFANSRFGISTALIQTINNTIKGNYLISNGQAGVVLGKMALNNTIESNYATSGFGGIILENSGFNKIVHNHLYGNANGIVLLNGSNVNLFLGNNISNNKDYGIYIDRSSRNLVQDNNLKNNGKYGLYLKFSNNSNVTDNNANDNYDGIFLEAATNNTVFNNTAVNNGNDGISLSKSGSNVVVGNRATNNSNNGISLLNSNENILKYNTLNDNYYGIYLDMSNGNELYLNNIINNSENLFASDAANSWNSSQPLAYRYKSKASKHCLGNFWSGYQGRDKDGDGIGDTPYLVGKDKDLNPLVNKFEVYTVTG